MELIVLGIIALISILGYVLRELSGRKVRLQGADILRRAQASGSAINPLVAAEFGVNSTANQEAWERESAAKATDEKFATAMDLALAAQESVLEVIQELEATAGTKLVFSDEELEVAEATGQLPTVVEVESARQVVKSLAKAVKLAHQATETNEFWWSDYGEVAEKILVAYLEGADVEEPVHEFFDTFNTVLRLAGIESPSPDAE